MIKTIRTIQNIFLKNGKEQDQSQETNGIIKEIPLDDIVEEDQVRKTMNEETVKELAVSIAQEGLLQPIGVHPMDNKKYKIIYGHRRYKAICLINNEASIKNLARENGHIQLNTVTALIRIRQPEKRNTITQMIENLQREKLNPHEEARALEEIKNKYDISIRELARRVSKPFGYVHLRLEILKLPVEGQNEIKEGRPISKVMEKYKKNGKNYLPKRKVNYILLANLLSSQLGEKEAFSDEKQAKLYIIDKQDKLG